MRNIKRKVLDVMNGDMNPHHLYTKRWLHYNHDLKLQNFFRRTWIIMGVVAAVGGVITCVSAIICIRAAIRIKTYADSPDDVVAYKDILHDVGYFALWNLCATVGVCLLIALIIGIGGLFYYIKKSIHLSAEYAICNSELSELERYFRSGVRDFVDACYYYRSALGNSTSVGLVTRADKFAPYVGKMIESGRSVIAFLEKMENDIADCGRINVAGWDYALAPVLVAMDKCEIGAIVNCHYHVSECCSDPVRQRCHIVKNAELMQILCLISIKILTLIEKCEKEDSVMQKLGMACESYSVMNVVSDVGNQSRLVWCGDRWGSVPYDATRMSVAQWLQDSVLPRVGKELEVAQIKAGTSTESAVSNVQVVGMQSLCR